MEALVPLLTELALALWGLKGKCGQHDANKKEIKSLLDFIQLYADYTWSLQKSLKEAGVTVGVGKNQLSEKLKTDIQEATKQLQEWAKDGNFFGRLLGSTQRLQDVESLKQKVMNSVQIAQNIRRDSVLLHQVAQGNRIESIVVAQGKRLESMQRHMNPVKSPKLQSEERDRDSLKLPLGASHHQTAQNSDVAHKRPHPFSHHIASLTLLETLSQFATLPVPPTAPMRVPPSPSCYPITPSWRNLNGRYRRSWGRTY